MKTTTKGRIRITMFSEEAKDAQTPPEAQNKEAEPAEQEKKPEAVKKEAATKEAPKTGKAARPANCVVCNKSIKKKWYYRNGKFYCCKGCWQQDVKKQAQQKEAAAQKQP